jgi:hypothetical protein
MAGQILFFYKNKADYTNTSVVATASQGAAYARRALDRSNLTAWITSGSVDADATTYDVDFGERRNISDVILIGHNFAAFTVKYSNDDGATWNDFSAPISVTGCQSEDSYFQVDKVAVQKIRVAISGTQISNSDKYLYQFIATEKLGRLEAWPQIKNVNHDRNLQAMKTLSGKMHFNANLGGFSCQLTVTRWSSQADMILVQGLYKSSEGFLVWPCGGDESQFKPLVEGYRMRDLYLMQCSGSFKPEFFQGVYSLGLNGLKIDLAEVIE